jgi:uncharacterized protein YuzE
MRVRYDPGSDALAIDLVEDGVSAGTYDHTVEVNGDVLGVDVDTDGRPLGIEVLFASEGFDLDPVIKRFGLEHLRVELEQIQVREFTPDLAWKKATPTS